MAVIDDLAVMLSSAIPSLVEGTTLQKTRLHEEPHDQVAIVQYGGIGPYLTHSGTERRWPRFQIISRAEDPEAAWLMAEQVRTVLRAVPQQQIGPIVYEVIRPLGEAHALARDTQGRLPVAQNYEVRWHAG